MLAQTPFLRNGAIKLERYVVPARLSVIAEIDKACPLIRYQSVDRAREGAKKKATGKIPVAFALRAD